MNSDSDSAAPAERLSGYDYLMRRRIATLQRIIEHALSSCHLAGHIIRSGFLGDYGYELAERVIGEALDRAGACQAQAAQYALIMNTIRRVYLVDRAVFRRSGHTLRSRSIPCLRVAGAMSEIEASGIGLQRAAWLLAEQLIDGEGQQRMDDDVALQMS